MILACSLSALLYCGFSLHLCCCCYCSHMYISILQCYCLPSCQPVCAHLSFTVPASLRYVWFLACDCEARSGNSQWKFSLPASVICLVILACSLSALLYCGFSLHLCYCCYCSHMYISILQCYCLPSCQPVCAHLSFTVPASLRYVWFLACDCEAILALGLVTPSGNFLWWVQTCVSHWVWL